MSLGIFDRATAIAALRSRAFDVLVVGGGITGAGVALDAASRGLRTALVERDDFASGTSSKSSKMVHGGLRYIDQGEIGLVYESLAERQRLFTNAPHLVHELPFLFPVLSRHGLFDKKLAKALGTTLWTYDLTGGARIGKLHKRLSAAETLAHMPGLPVGNVAGGYLYYDCRADDARLTLTLARTAAIDHGATVANRVSVTALHDPIDGLRRVTVRADDQTFDVSTHVVINATGVWADGLRDLDDGDAASTIRPAKGSHVTVPWSRVGTDVAVVLPVRADKRSVFIVPWGDQAYIGTTDTDYDGPLDDPHCTSDDVAYLLTGVNASTTLDLCPADVTGTWAGLRPLVADGPTTGRTADLSRRHRITSSPSGMVSVTGGKLTTYRAMAADAVDAAVDHLGQLDLPLTRRCRTKRLPLVGARGLREARRHARLHPRLGPARGQHLVDRFGSETAVLIAMIDADPSLAEPLDARLPYLAVEALYAVRYEMAITLDDVLARRTRARLRSLAATSSIAQSVAELIAADLGWSAARCRAEVTECRRALAADAAVACLPDPLAVAI